MRRKERNRYTDRENDRYMQMGKQLIDRYIQLASYICICIKPYPDTLIANFLLDLFHPRYTIYNVALLHLKSHSFVSFVPVSNFINVFSCFYKYQSLYVAKLSIRVRLTIRWSWRRQELFSEIKYIQKKFQESTLDKH